ncbi:MAG: BlaI/MecI/CopY family transcriptional regulator [Myxococcota bacterium]
MQETEWDVLGVLWDRREATARDVADALKESRGWAMSTVRTMLERMRSKELVSGRRVGNVWLYAPAVPRVDAQRSAWKRFIDTAFDGTAGALHFLARDAKLTKRQRDKLLALLEEGNRDE